MNMLHSPSSADAMLADVALLSDRRDATPLARHLFVLTDDALFLDLLREVLEEGGYRVTATAFVPATFAAIAASQPALVLLDLGTRERLGWALLARLHDEATTRAIPVVVASTQRDHLARAQDDVARYGSLSVLEMPFDIDDLLAVVRAALLQAAGGGAREAWWGDRAG